MTPPNPSAKMLKSKRFRQLLPEISKLCETYTYEGVVEILKQQYDFEINVSTFGVYYRKYSKEQGDGTKNPIRNNNPDFEVNDNVEPVVKSETTENTAIQDFLMEKSQTENTVSQSHKVAILEKAIQNMDKNPLDYI